MNKLLPSSAPRRIAAWASGLRLATVCALAAGLLGGCVMFGDDILRDPGHGGPVVQRLAPDPVAPMLSEAEKQRQRALLDQVMREQDAAAERAARADLIARQNAMYWNLYSGWGWRPYGGVGFGGPFYPW